jgi:hypothetical protein
MKKRTSIFVAMFLRMALRMAFGLTVVAPLGACMSSGDGAGGTGGTSGGTGGHAGGAGTGGAGPANCGAGGSAGGSDLANYATMMFIVSASCGGPGCHNDTQTPKLFEGDLYTTLTTYKAAKCGNRFLVNPCSPNDSAFYLAQMGQCAGLDRMPKGCVDNCTPDNYLEGIRQWIANGAPRQ